VAVRLVLLVSFMVSTFISLQEIHEIERELTPLKAKLASYQDLPPVRRQIGFYHMAVILLFVCTCQFGEQLLKRTYKSS